MSHGFPENLPRESGEGQSSVNVAAELSPLTANASVSSEFPEAATSISANGDSSPNNTSSSSPISKALSSIICSLSSQDHLSFAIDRLTRELDQLLEDIMHHATKISGVRKRVSSLNSVLKSIQRRVDKIDQSISAGSHSGTYILS